MPPPDVLSDVPANTPDVNTTVQTSTPRELRNLLIIQDLEDDQNYRSIASKHGVSLGLIAKVAKEWHAIQGVSRKLMAGQALSALDDWRIAREEAAKKGDHRPAKDWLLHAEEITPLAESPKTGIVINVGNGSSPTRDVNQVPTITVQTVENKALTNE